MITNIHRGVVLALLLATVAIPRLAHGQDPSATKKPDPLVQMDGVPFDAAIRNLARQLEINYILDARIVRPSGDLASNPSVTGRWNLTALKVLEQVLHDKGLMMITNNVTSIARIVRTNDSVPSVSTKLVGGDADPAIPRLRIDHPLDKAIAEVATKAHLNISVDRRLPVPSAEPGTTMADCQVYFEWENITARQALTAILDNYDLAIAKDPVSSSLKIVMKPRSGAPTAEKGLSTVK